MTSLLRELGTPEGVQRWLEDPYGLASALSDFRIEEPAWVLWLRATRRRSRAGMLLQALASRSRFPEPSELSRAQELEPQDIEDGWLAVADAVDQYTGDPLIGEREAWRSLLQWLLDVARFRGFRETRVLLRDAADRHSQTPWLSLAEQTISITYQELLELFDDDDLLAVRFEPERPLAPGEYPCPECKQPRHHSQERCYVCGAL